MKLTSPARVLTAITLRVYSFFFSLAVRRILLRLGGAPARRIR